MSEDCGLFYIVIIPNDILRNMGHIKCITNKNYFHLNEEENYRFKKSTLTSKEVTHKSFCILKIQ